MMNGVVGSNPFIYLNADTFGEIIKKLDTESILNLSESTPNFYSNDTLWEESAKKHHLETSEKGEALRNLFQSYLKTPQEVEAITIDQNEKILETKKYKITVCPETKVSELVNEITHQKFVPTKSYSVALTARNGLPSTHILDFEPTINAIVGKKEKPLDDHVEIYSRNSSEGEPEIDGTDITLFAPNPRGGPFGIYNTPKNETNWTWQNVDIKKHFPSAENTSLNTSIGTIQTKQLVLHRPKQFSEKAV